MRRSILTRQKGTRIQRFRRLLRKVSSALLVLYLGFVYILLDVNASEDDLIAALDRIKRLRWRRYRVQLIWMPITPESELCSSFCQVCQATQQCREAHIRRLSIVGEILDAAYLDYSEFLAKYGPAPDWVFD
nr:MAG TPA: hypothetical protein [Bacteriophage sp.]